MFILSFDGRLGTAPPNDLGAKVGRVLDVGTGTGIWAIDFADEHPEAEVCCCSAYSPPLLACRLQSQILGVDLSAIQPSL